VHYNFQTEVVKSHFYNLNISHKESKTTSKLSVKRCSCCPSDIRKNSWLRKVLSYILSAVISDCMAGRTDGTDTCHITNSEFASKTMICVPHIMVGDPGAEYVDVAVLFV